MVHDGLALELAVADHRPVQALLLAIMLASLLMSSAIGQAFSDRAWLFVVPYVAIQVGRAAFATVTFVPGSTSGSTSSTCSPGRSA